VLLLLGDQFLATVGADHIEEVGTVRQIMARSRPRKREPGRDPAGMWAIECARLRDRGYSHADAARLATLHMQGNSSGPYSGQMVVIRDGSARDASWTI
jgi:hypothetical protein